jgi:hypothetical protein
VGFVGRNLGSHLALKRTVTGKPFLNISLNFVAQFAGAIRRVALILGGRFLLLQFHLDRAEAEHLVLFKKSLLIDGRVSEAQRAMVASVKISDRDLSISYDQQGLESCHLA